VWFLPSGKQSVCVFVCLYDCHTDEIFAAVCINDRFIKAPKLSVSAGFMSVITNSADYSEENIERK